MLRNYCSARRSNTGTDIYVRKSDPYKYTKMTMRAQYAYGVPAVLGFVAGGPAGATAAMAMVPEAIVVPWIIGGTRR